MPGVHCNVCQRSVYAPTSTLCEPNVRCVVCALRSQSDRFCLFVGRFFYGGWVSFFRAVLLGKSVGRVSWSMEGILAVWNGTTVPMGKMFLPVLEMCLESGGYLVT